LTWRISFEEHRSRRVSDLEGFVYDDDERRAYRRRCECARCQTVEDHLRHYPAVLGSNRLGNQPIPKMTTNSEDEPSCEPPLEGFPMGVEPHAAARRVRESRHGNFARAWRHSQNSGWVPRIDGEEFRSEKHRQDLLWKWFFRGKTDHDIDPAQPSGAVAFRKVCTRCISRAKRTTR